MVGGGGTFAPQDYRAMREFVTAEGAAADFVLVHQGSGERGDLERWPDYAAAGVDWWLESFRAETRSVADAWRLLESGRAPGPG